MVILFISMVGFQAAHRQLRAASIFVVFFNDLRFLKLRKIDFCLFCFFASMQQVQDQNSSYVIIIVVINNDQSINDVMKAPTISAESWHRFSDLRFWFCFRRRFCDFLRFVSSFYCLRFLDVQWSFLTCQKPKHGRRHRLHCDLKEKREKK